MMMLTMMMLTMMMLTMMIVIVMLAVVFQLNEPSLVEGLVLINIDPCAKGWMDWAASKVSVSYTRLYLCFISCVLTLTQLFPTMFKPTFTQNLF